MKRLIVLFILLAYTISASILASDSKSHSEKTGITHADIEGVYIFDNYMRSNQGVLRKNIKKESRRRFSMTIELREDSIALFRAITSTIPNDNWGHTIGQGTWRIEGDNVSIVLDEISPALYPIKTKYGYSHYISYPYSQFGLIGEMILKIRRINDRVILTAPKIVLQNFICESTESFFGYFVMNGECSFIKSDNDSIQTWQERLSKRMIQLHPDKYPRDINPRPIEIGRDSTIKIIRQGKLHYDSINSYLAPDDRKSYEKLMEYYFLSIPYPFYGYHYYY